MDILIVDDEPLARRTVRDALDAEDGVRVVGECETGEEALTAIRECAPDLVFLDIQMPGLGGFEVLERLGEAAPEIVFVTAHDEHALRAFEVHAVDYLLKPFSDGRFRESMRRARERAAAPRLERAGRLRRLLRRLALAETSSGAEFEDGPQGLYATRFTVRADDRVRFVRTRDVDWFEADGNYVVLHVGEEVHRMRTTLIGVEAQLDPASFVRVHRSAIVNLDAIREVQPWFGGDHVAVMRTGDQVRVSRTYRDSLLRKSF